MPNNELQEILSKRFENHLPPSNESVWTAIEAQLAEGKTDRAGIWFWIMNGLAASLLVSFMVKSGISTQEMMPTPQKIHAQTTLETSQEKRIDSNKTSEIPVEEVTERQITSANVERDGEEPSKLTQKRDRTVSERILPEEKSFQEITRNASNLVANSENHVDALAIHPIHLSIEPKNKELNSPYIPITNLSNSGFLQRLPIHLGVELTYMNRLRTAQTKPSTQNLDIDNILADARHLEFGLRAQFDLTGRISARVGLGYSSSKFNFSDTPTLAASTSVSKSGHQQNITIPIQVAYSFVRRNRFKLAAGVSFQTEFTQKTQFENSEPTPIASTGSFYEASEVTSNYSKSKSTQFAIQPYGEISLQISPRVITFAQLGYRSYLNKKEVDAPSIGKMHYLTSSFGVLFRIH